MTDNDPSGVEELDALVETAETAFAEAELRFGEGDDYLVEAGKALLRARQLVQDGALGSDIKWTAWIRKNTSISDSWCRQLIRIAKADDPKAEARAYRESNRERQQKHRERKQKEVGKTEQSRLLLHDYIEGADLGTVHRLLAKEFHEIAGTTKMVNRRMPQAKTPKTLADAA